jgi:hypothetical protein
MSGSLNGSTSKQLTCHAPLAFLSRGGRGASEEQRPSLRDWFAEDEAMIAFRNATTALPRSAGRRRLLFLGIADDFDDLEDWMFGASEAPRVSLARFQR